MVVLEEKIMSESVVERVRQRFAEQLSRYRELVRASAAAGGELPSEQVDEVLAIAAELGIPGERFPRDETAVIAERNLEQRIAEIRQANEQTIADVPALESELAVILAEFGKAKRAWELRRDEMEREMAARRRAIAAERQRPRQSTASIEAELRRVHESNPVMFRTGATPEEFPQLLEVRQVTFGNV